MESRGYKYHNAELDEFSVKHQTVSCEEHSSRHILSHSVEGTGPTSAEDVKHYAEEEVVCISGIGKYIQRNYKC